MILIHSAKSVVKICAPRFMNISSMADKISNLESTRLCPSQTSTTVQQPHRRSTDWNVPPDILSNASMFCPPAYSPIPSAPRRVSSVQLE